MSDIDFMSYNNSNIKKRIIIVLLFFISLLFISMFAGIISGSSKSGIIELWNSILGKETDTISSTIIWRIRFPRVCLAALTGATLAIGGVVFQAILRNPLAEPYILGISGGSAIGAIIGILLGFSRFPGITLLSFSGSLTTLLIILMVSSKQSIFKDSLLLSGVMVNAFCSALMMFFISITQDSRLHNIMFWLMGDFSVSDINQVGILAILLLPCFLLLFFLSNTMNILLLGRKMALSMGVNVRVVILVLLVTTSFMVSSSVSQCGLVGFVGLVVPHLLRMIIGPDHRVLIPASILGGASYVVLCDLIARVVSKNSQMPVGVVTAMIGAPLFIFLLNRVKQ